MAESEEQGGGGGGSATTDPRLDAINDYTLKTLKVKADKWTKMLSQDEFAMMLNDFLEKGDCRVLLISLTSAGQLLPTNKFPSALKNKAVYFVKKNPEPIKKGKFKVTVMYGEMSTVPLEQLTIMVDNVMLPLIGNECNHIQWPHVVSQDVLKHTGGLKGDVQVLSGRVKGKTLLPLPPEAEKSPIIGVDDIMDIESHLYEKQLIHSVESVVIEWCHLIRDVLQKSSAETLLAGMNPGPLVEIEFWNSRCADLESVEDQLSTPKVQKMCILLERTQSSYYPAFRNMLDSVKAALTEAQDISMHLKPLRIQFENVEECDYLELPLRFPAVFHIVCLIWANSTHYRHPARLVVLLQEVSNLVIDLTRGYITDEILHMETEEGLEKVQDALKVCSSYKDNYHIHRGKLTQYFKGSTPVVEWSFQPHLIFARLDRFLDHLATIENYFQTSLEYLKLEKVAFGGSKGQVLTGMVMNIFNEFNELMNKFTNSSYDPLDDTSDFVVDYSLFIERIDDYDQRLASILCQAFHDCSGCESVFKLLDMMGSFLERPLIQKDFNENYQVLVKMCDQELDSAKVIFDDQLARANTPQGPILNKNMPRVAGMLKWSQELRDRVNSSLDKLKNLDKGHLQNF